METYIILDIETIPNESIEKPIFDETTVKLGNVKDQEKRALKIAEAEKAFEFGLTKKMSVESDLCRILSIGYILIEKNGFDWIEKERDVFYGEKDDCDILVKFNNMLAGIEHVVFCGWNSKSFDLTIIWKRLVTLGMHVNFNYLECVKKYNAKNSVDLMHIWNNFERGKLSTCCKTLGIECKTGMDGSMIYDAFKAGKVEEIKKYNMEDCEATLSILKRIGGSL